MFRNLLLVVPMLVVSGALVATPTAAQASQATEFGMVTINNPTNDVVHYQMRWGNGDWTSYTLQPGEYYVHYRSLDEYGRTPRPQVRFDTILNDGALTYQNYNLGFNASYHVGFWDGKVYEFRTRGGGTLLDLLAI